MIYLYRFSCSENLSLAFNVYIHVFSDWFMNNAYWENDNMILDENLTLNGG